MFAIFKKGKTQKFKFYGAFSSKDGADIELDHSRALKEDEPKVLEYLDFDFKKIEEYEREINA